MVSGINQQKSIIITVLIFVFTLLAREDVFPQEGPR